MQDGMAATREVFIGHAGIPILAAIRPAVPVLQGLNMRRKVQPIVSGGIRNGAAVAKALAPAADATATGTPPPRPAGPAPNGSPGSGLPRLTAAIVPGEGAITMARQSIGSKGVYVPQRLELKEWPWSMNCLALVAAFLRPQWLVLLRRSSHRV